jgi:hypothetical protein
MELESVKRMLNSVHRMQWPCTFFARFHIVSELFPDFSENKLWHLVKVIPGSKNKRRRRRNAIVDESEEEQEEEMQEEEDEDEDENEEEE